MNNDLVVTYRPQPGVWCPTCRNDTPLAAAIDGSLRRPSDIDQIQRNHVCGPPASPWNHSQQATAALSVAPGSRR